MVISCLARVEVPAAIWRKHRIGELTAGDVGALIADFEVDYHGSAQEPERFAVVCMPPVILDEAARQVAAHGLRAYDAIQLASGVAARRADPDCLGFACFDEELRAAAAAEGFQLVPSLT